MAAPRIIAPHYSSRTRKPRTYESCSLSPPFPPAIALTATTEHELLLEMVDFTLCRSRLLTQFTEQRVTLQ